MSIDPVLEAEYNNRVRVPESAAIMARWQAASAAYRASATSDLDLSYDAGERHKYDLFHPSNGDPRAPLVIYIHGGYWQRGDRKDYSFVARELNARGFAVAIPSYPLCPDVTVGTIITDMQKCAIAIWQRSQQRPVVVGHSAGGHLAACLISTDWDKIADVPRDLIRMAYSISGVFELAPLVQTSLNAALKLDVDAAERASPLRWPPPRSAKSFVTSVGGLESGEFHRQSLALAAKWRTAGVSATSVVVPDTNHFTIVDELVRPGSDMLAAITTMTQVSVG